MEWWLLTCFRVTKLALRVVNAAKEGDTKGFVGLVRELKPVLDAWKDAVRGQAERDEQLRSASEQVERTLAELLQASKHALASNATDQQRQEATRQGKRLAGVIQSWKTTHEAVMQRRKPLPKPGASEAAAPTLTKSSPRQPAEKADLSCASVANDWMGASAEASVAGVLQAVAEKLRQEKSDNAAVRRWTNRLIEQARLVDCEWDSKQGKQLAETLSRLRVLQTQACCAPSDGERRDAMQSLLDECDRLLKIVNGSAQRRRFSEAETKLEVLSLEEEQPGDEQQMMLESDGEIRFASLNQLIFQLTDESENAEFVRTFFDTCHTFVSCELLLEKLKERFDSLGQRMHSIVNVWIQRTLEDWDLSQVEMAREWIRDSFDGKVSDKLLQSISRAIVAYNAGLLEDTKQSFLRCRLGAGVAATSEQFLELKGELMVEQICLVCGDLFRALSLRQLTGGDWIKSSTQHRATGVVRMREFEEALASFTQQSMVSESSLRGRQKLARKWIKVATQLVELRCFSGAAAVVNGLAAPSVSRLKFSFALIPAAELQQLEECNRLLNSRNSFSRLQTHLASLGDDVSAVPYLGACLSSVLFAHHATPDTSSAGLIAWKKRRLLAEVVSQIERFRNVAYAFERHEPAVEFLMALMPAALTNDDLMELSLSAEPRGTTDKSELAQ